MNIVIPNDCVPQHGDPNESIGLAEYLITSLLIIRYTSNSWTIVDVWLNIV